MLSIAHVLAMEIALTLAGVAIPALPAELQTSAPPRTSASLPAPAPARRAAPPTTLAARGKILAFDEAARSLTIATAAGDERFTLNDTTRLRHASRAISGAELAKLTGHQATVRYHQSAGQKRVLSVRVASAPVLAESKSTDFGGLP
ncbi:MAG TPA: hypothetical protein VFJ02_22640 [Vicinamibacterales bacterium]|nr:hypothetical protein [Vicinamibacterales bacterium]